MNRDKDAEFVTRAREQLELHAQDTDELTRARLAAMRKQALEQTARPAYRWLRATGLATAAAALLAVLLWQQHAGDLQGVQDDWDILAAGEELELIEELEFYDWLESTQSSS